MPTPTDREHWSVDKRIPLVVLICFVLQFGGAVWWVAEFRAEVRADREARQRLEQRVSVIENQRVGERLLVLETQLSDAKAVLQRIDERTQRLVDRRPQP